MTLAYLSEGGGGGLFALAQGVQPSIVATTGLVEACFIGVAVPKDPTSNAAKRIMTNFFTYSLLERNNVLPRS